MIWHPLVWAFWAAAVTGSVLYAVAGLGALDVVLNYRPDRADRRQLRCERRAEAAALLGKWSLGVLAAAALIGLIGITRAWHALIPGAMCGTGVLQAMGADGKRALLFWGTVLAILYGWQVLERLDNTCPERPGIQHGARLLLTAAPFLTLALFHTWQALMRIDGAPTVSCCAAVYDRALISPATVQGRAWIVALGRYAGLAGTLILPAAAILAQRCPQRVPAGMVAGLALGWTAAATIAVKHIWSAYYYQVLSHPCPWCLFLPDTNGAGFLIFGCLALIVLESLALWVANAARRRHPQLTASAERRGRRAVMRMVTAIAVYTLLTAGSAILWRLRTGVWMDGSL